MPELFKTKILILGPCQSGKTAISNYLADAAELHDEYRPTQGVRIVEFESSGLEMNGKQIDAEVELWDCSGDRKFKPCWPALQKDADGVILVADKRKKDQIVDLEKWYTAFATQKGIPKDRVLVFLHHIPLEDGEESHRSSSAKLPSLLSGIQSLSTDIESDGEALRLRFNTFLCDVIAGIGDAKSWGKQRSTMVFHEDENDATGSDGED